MLDEAVNPLLHFDLQNIVPLHSLTETTPEWVSVKTGSPQVLLGGPGGQGTRVEVSPDTSRA